LHGQINLEGCLLDNHIGTGFPQKNKKAKNTGMRMVIYLYDILIMNSSKEGVKGGFKKPIDLLQHIGFLINF
jgi:hypothetical protein